MYQRLVNTFYRHPKAKLKTYRRFGGYLNYRKMLAYRKQMQQAAKALPPVKSYPDGLSIYLLTGKDFLYQTLFCIRSLAINIDTKFRYVLVDDGTFNKAIIDMIHQQLPGAIMVTGDSIEQNLQTALPQQQYPHLNKKRKEYPHLKKLTDIHTLPGGPWKLVLDSDMLFWHAPSELIKWLQNPLMPLHMVDCADAYGYTRSIMEELLGDKIQPLINVGAIGLNSTAINWDKLELWLATLEEKEGGSYYLEQALTAMIIGSSDTVALPSAEYMVNPDQHSIKEGKGILHHYVDLSKEGYFKVAWKKLIIKDGGR